MSCEPGLCNELSVHKSIDFRFYLLGGEKMAEYIEKAAILSKCEEMWNNADETTQTGVDTINAIDRITDLIEAMPAIDVQPVDEGYLMDWYISSVSEDDSPIWTE